MREGEYGVSSVISTLDGAEFTGIAGASHTHARASGAFLPCQRQQAPGTVHVGSRVPGAGGGACSAGKHRVLTFPAEVPALVRYCPVAGLHRSGALGPQLQAQTLKSRTRATLFFLDKQFYFR